MKSLIHKPLSLITTTRIRGLDAFTVLAAFLLGALWLASALHVSAAGEQLPAGEGLRGGKQLYPAVGDFFSFFFLTFLK